MAAQNQGDLFDAYFRRADVDRDGRISGAEAVTFFQGSNLPKQVLAQIWTYADQNRTGYLGRTEFYNALKLVTVAQSKRELTPDIVKAALFSPASAKIPAPQINMVSTPVPQPSAAGPTQMGTVAPTASQNPGFRGAAPILPNTNMNQQHNQSPVGGLVRPSNAVSGLPTRPSPSPSPVQGVGFQGFPGGASSLVSSLPNNRVSSDTGGGAPRGSSPLTTQPGLPSGTPGSVASSASSGVQPKPPVSQNGFASGSLFAGDAFSATASQLKRDGSVPTSSSAGSVPVSSNIQPSFKQGSLDAIPNPVSAQPGGQLHKMPSIPKQNQQVPVQNLSPPSGPPAASAHNSAGHQTQLQWPRPTQTDLQKYTRVFMEVDTDKDGKITGEQARNLFLSWRLPREVLKQVWDLSDQDNDSMLSLREFCIALYLMERYREGRPLPAVLPSNVLLDFPATAQPTGGYGNAAWGSSPGFQQPHAVPGTGARPNARPPGKPPLPVPASSSDDRMPPKPQKPKVPVLEKHLVDQLSEEEQKSLNLKFQEASEATKRVDELEKEIKESREKMEFYRVKMQELVLYKSRCDSRLNEVSERAAGDKREVESLAKKYEEKYRQAGDVASKLSIEEATFRDIQERKMEMYQAIVKMEQDGTAEDLQARADRIQSSLEELVKSLSERCKKYGLRGKPTTLLELPFGWQPGIQEGAADWDEDWDKFEDEGFTFVKELTLDVQNVIAPPKTKAKLAKKEKKSAGEGEAAMHASDAESKSVEPAAEHERVPENGTLDNQKEDDSKTSPVAASPFSATSTPRNTSKHNHFEKTVSSDLSPRARESQSDASFSGGKSFDEPAWGTFDTNDDVDSVWGTSKETEDHRDRSRHIDDLFGHGNWNLPPIKTGSLSSQQDGFLPKKSIFADSVPGTPADGFLPKKSIFADSVPGTPADGFLPKKSIFADSVPGTPADGFFPKKNSIFADSVPGTPAGDSYLPKKSSIFADSVPSTPLFSSSSYSHSSPQKNTEDRGFFNFSRFDSFRSTDSGFQPHERGTTKDFDSPKDGGESGSYPTFSRFDSMRSSRDFDDYGNRFDDSDTFAPGFGSSGLFRSSLGSETPRSEIDAFGSVGPFGSSLASETPRAEADPFGSVGHFRSSETPRADPFGSVGPFSSSFGGETPRRESDYFGYSGSFRSSSFASETPRGEFDSFGFGGPFGSSLGSETPRRDSDPFGSTGPFRSSVGSETPKGGTTDSWSAF